MNELLKQLGEIEIQFKLLEAKKTSLIRQLLEQLKNEPTTSTETGEAEATRSQGESTQSEESQGTPIY